MNPRRQLREPLSQAEFNQLSLVAKTLKLQPPWFNLRWSIHATAAHTFFASRSGRLTPSSGAVPCLYLARDAETSFEELYGDFCDAAEKRGTAFALRPAEAANRLLVRTTEETELKICDLTRPGVAKQIGLDLGTLYAPEIRLTREFAQRLHDHPAKFDGIVYRSRLMSTKCVVLWETHRRFSILLEKHSTLADHLREDSAIDPDYRLFKRRVSLVGIPVA